MLRLAELNRAPLNVTSGIQVWEMNSLHYVFRLAMLNRAPLNVAHVQPVEDAIEQQLKVYADLALLEN